jgi:Fe-S-cluster containining protein
MDRETSFSYQCGRCSRCCYYKDVRVNPFEVQRLSRSRNTDTTEFLRRYTDADGTLLRKRSDGACIFLTSEGCSVYSDRPLVCRIYPLRRHVGEDGVETFSNEVPHPKTAGQYGQTGTVDSYLQEQDAAPYLDAANLYLSLFQNMTETLNGEVAKLGSVDREEVARHCAKSGDQAYSATSWLDMDAVVGWHCSEHGVAPPDDPWAQTQLHVHLLSVWSKQLTSGENL